MEEKQVSEQKNGSLLKVLLIIAVNILIILGVLFIVFTRYKLVSRAIDAGDSVTSALLLTPEIAQGISNILG